MKLKFILLLFLFFLIIPLAAQANASDAMILDADSIKIGFKGYYRRGHWTPLKVRMQTGPQAFTGTINLQIDNTNHIFSLKMPPGSTREISGLILIHSSHPRLMLSQLDHQTGQSITEPLNLSLKEVKDNEFLIGVERKIADTFRREFAKFSDASRHVRWFSFFPEELPVDLAVYETPNLLVLSADGLKTPSLADTLARWHDSGLVNILIYQGGKINLETLHKLTSERPTNPSLRPDVIRLFEPPSGHYRFRKTIFRALLFYFFISLIILVFRLRTNQEKQPALAFAGIGLASILVTLAMLTVFFRPGSLISGESVQVIIRHPNEKISHQHSFFSLSSLRPEPVSIPIKYRQETIRPLFRDEAELLNNPLTISLYNDDDLEKKILLPAHLIGNEALTLFEKSTPRSDLNMKITTLAGTHRFINESEVYLRNAYLVDQNDHFFLGDLPSWSETLLTPKKPAISAVQWKTSLGTQSRTARYQQRLLEFCLRRFQLENRTYVFGWSQNKGGRFPISPIDYYPTLWIIIVE